MDGGYEAIAEEYSGASAIVDGYDAYVKENGKAPTGDFQYDVEDEETLEVSQETASLADYEEAKKTVEKIGDEPDPADYGTWVPGIPALVEKGLDAANAAEWLKGLVLDGIVGGVGAVLGLSGKSFIPMLVAVGCGVPGVMASRTIENERDRRMTIMTTTFIPCGAKVPFIAMIAGAIFGGSSLKASIVSTSAYFIGMAAIVVSGIMLKKTKMFAGDPAPFVMELPPYHLPTLGNVLRSMWERGWSFIKKAGTVILLSTIIIWFTSFFGFAEDGFRMLSEEELEYSLLAKLGGVLSWIFVPLGWGNWQATVASITGLVAKENIVGTMGILYGSGELTTWQALASAFTSVTGFSFLVFNLLCAPCFAAIGAIKREMNSAKWTWFAILYQCGFAYVIAFMINQFGGLFTGNMNVIGVVFAVAALVAMIYMLFFKKYKEADKLTIAN